MSAEWAEGACEAWNQDQTLTGNLAKWASNDADRGFKVIQLYRMDCEESPHVELRISMQEEKVVCVYGGAVETAELVKGVDYLMFAQTARWEEMGAGNYSPMKAMLFGRLKFQGPKWEAMNNMGPFASFLRLTGQVPGDAEVCPQ